MPLLPKRQLTINPNMSFDSIADMEHWLQTNIPGAQIVRTYEVKMLRCEVAAPKRGRINMPPVCIEANLFGFADEKSMNHFLDKQCGHLTIMAKWQCKICNCWHCWTYGCHSDSNGDMKAGAENMPEHVRELIKRTAKV